MRDPAGEARTELPNDGEEIGMGIALMQEHRLANLRRELELLAERRLLGLMRREMTEVVQPALTDGDDVRMLYEFAELFERGVV